MSSVEPKTDAEPEEDEEDEEEDLDPLNMIDWSQKIEQQMKT